MPGSSAGKVLWGTNKRHVLNMSDTTEKIPAQDIFTLFVHIARIEASKANS